jgi:hypothetical protein
MTRAAEESRQKSKRLRSAWASERAKIGKRPLTRKGSWLRWDGKRWQIVEKHPETVRLMVDVALAENTGCPYTTGRYKASEAVLAHLPGLVAQTPSGTDLDAACCRRVQRREPCCKMRGCE